MFLLMNNLRSFFAVAAASITFFSCGRSTPNAQPAVTAQPAAVSEDRSTLPPQPSADERAAFWKFWGDGNGEISSYKTTQSRYGELRHGYDVMIFVTEEISRKTRIKVESDKIPQDDRVPVLKLNRVSKFPTGIYDYSLLTSVFSAVEPELGNHPLQALKVSNTVQEWCGSFFGMWHTNANALAYTRHSYFESEGDTDNMQFQIPADEWEYEDNLPILIRDLKGDWMKMGETKTIQLLPSIQHQRFTHDKIQFLPATVTKSDGGSVSVGGKTYPSTIHWKWSYTDDSEGFPQGSKSVTEDYWTEAAYPHRILKWESSDGSNGELMESQRLPYWSMHDNAYAYLRKDLKIPEN